MVDTFIIKTWDGKGKFKSKKLDVEFWFNDPLLGRKLINKRYSFNFSPEEITKYGTKEKATIALFKSLGEEGRHRKKLGVLALALLTIPPEYKEVYDGE